MGCVRTQKKRLPQLALLSPVTTFIMAVWAVRRLSGFNGTKDKCGPQARMPQKNRFSHVTALAMHSQPIYYPSGFHESDLVSPARFLDDRRIAAFWVH